MTRSICTRPLCVVDCNFIQQSRDDASDVPPGWDCLLISSVFGELANKPSSDREFLFKRFSTWIRRNAMRLWLSRDMPSIIRSHEPAPTRVRRIRSYDLIDHSYTRKLRRLLSNTDSEFRAPLELPEVKVWLAHGEIARSSFLGFTDQCREFVLSQPGRPNEKLPHTPEDIRRFVQQFPVERIIGCIGAGPNYRDPRWHVHLNRFPDRLLIAKKVRLDIYYAIRRSLGDSRKFGNNWDDIHYAIAASFTGHIATNDARLIKACEMLAPGVRIFRASGV